MKAVAQHLMSNMNMTASMMAKGTLMSTRDQFCIKDDMAEVVDPNAPPILLLIVAESGRQAVLATVLEASVHT